jgi:hypothetical protein
MRALESLWGPGIVMSGKVKPKTLREVFELYNSFPRGRRIVGYVSTAGWLVFFVAFWLAVYYGTGFITYLVLAFLAFLCTTHSNYAFAQNLTQRKVRRIDYWYLGTAAIGLLLFAAAYSNQRDVVLTKIFVAAHQSGEEPIREQVVSSLANLSDFLCTDGMLRTFPKPCEGLKSFSKEIRPHLSSEQISGLSEKFANEVTSPYTRIFPIEKLKENPRIISPLSIIQVRLDDRAAYMRTAPSQTAVQRDEESEIVFGLGQLVIWPFLLAYALALRITKVTIDVFEWAK